MEIPVLNRITGFEAGITRFPNPSLISRAFHFSALEDTIKIRTLWTWGALIIALLATFSSLITRIKLLIFRLRKGTSVISQPLLQQLYDEDSDEDDDVRSSISSEEEYDESSSSDGEDDATYENTRKFDEDFRVAGCNYEGTLGHRRNFSWSDFVNGKSVVKSWEGFGLSESLISLWDSNKSDISTDISAFTMPSPSVIVSAGLETSRNVALRVFDTRVGRQIPQIFSEWQQPNRLQRFSGEDNGEDVRVSSVVVRDLRKIATPLENVTESDVITWFDADAVVIDDGEICKLGNGSVVSRCRNAVFSYLF
ncbi:hypothetical protein ACHQM5_009186 [Ranunculus cassubicifolius]